MTSAKTKKGGCSTNLATQAPQGVHLFYYWIYRILYTFWLPFLYQMEDFQRLFFHSGGCLSSLLAASFVAQKFFISAKPSSSIFFFSFVTCASGVPAKKPLPHPRSQRLTNLFSKSFIVLALKLRSLIHFQLIFVYGGRKKHTLFFCMWLSTYPICWKTILSPLNCLGTLVQNQLTVNVGVYFWTLSSVPSMYMSILMPCHTVLYTQLCVKSETMKCESSNFVVFQNCFG